MEFQFGTNWARFSRVRRRRHRPDARDGRHVRVLPRVELPRRCCVFGERRLGPRGHFLAAARALRRQLALRLLHHRDQRLHAAPGRPRDRRRRHPRQLARLLGVPVQPVGASRSTRTRWRPAWSRRRSWWRPSARTTRSRGSHLEHARAVPPDRRRRRARVAACSSRSRPAISQAKLVAAAPAGRARRDGGTLRERAARRHHDHRPAQRDGAARSTTRSSSPAFLSFLAYGDVPQRTCKGLNEFPEDQWPDNIELLYYSFHVMAGLGTLFIAVMALAALFLLARDAGALARRCSGR